jgi:LysR family glycine cleavage system transcriptional activator
MVRCVTSSNSVPDDDKISLVPYRWAHTKIAMTRTIPPLNPLHVFEVVARTGNFTKAAKELRVTQSAVSRQIATLEAYLGLKLFVRQHQGISLTTVGQSYWNEIAPAFAAISASTERLKSEQSREALRIDVYPTFAVKWLIPRLPEFNRLHPNIEIRLTTGIRPVNFAASTIDLAIQLANPAELADEFQVMFMDQLQPFCSAKYATEHELETLDDLKSVLMLHSHYRRGDWLDWLHSQGRPELWSPGIEFPSSILSYKAAAEGMGVVIGQTLLVEEDVVRGELLPLFQPVERELAYCVMWERNTEPNLKGRTFVKWLMNEVKKAKSLPAA